ncbi:MAG: hypothetical protein H7240_09095 [Glaciimonas sp.]|nr:hypothetical protein [Glaciimonas sp.]
MSTHTSPRIEFVIANLRLISPKKWPDVVEKTGVPLGTLRKIAYRETRDPRGSTLDPLHAYFDKQKTKIKPPS